MGSPGPDKTVPAESAWDTPSRPAAVAADPASAESLPRGLFSPYSAVPKGERVVVVHKPAMIWILLRTPRRIAGLFVALLVLVVWGKLLGHGAGGYGAELVGLGVLLLALQVSWNVLNYEARWYVVTERRLMSIGGVVGRFSSEMPLDSVRGIVVMRPWLERFVGVGSVGFGSAATGGLEVLWVAVASADQIADRVRTQIANPPPKTTTRKRAAKKPAAKKATTKKTASKKAAARKAGVKKPPTQPPPEGGTDA